eukprot:TRINITY_DN2206_c0_g1_i2.p1 TRINITY_DN2206_c0_g1~~TRINITY_DN2206_c0_g1_i2.p1  ORF type:complete len:326 (+),score=41.44 TRINITY_DN2206_c0_g1_i2:140-1117(+)
MSSPGLGIKRPEERTRLKAQQHALKEQEEELGERAGCCTLVFRFLSSNWSALLISVLFIFLTAAQTVTLPLWAGSLTAGSPGHVSAPYVILMYTSISQAVCNATASLFCWLLLGLPEAPPFRHNVRLYLAVGVSLAVNGLVLVYAALPNRTPEILQALLLNTGFIYSIPASKFLVEEKSNYKFCAWKPIISVGMVTWGIVISLIPLILNVVYGDEPIFTGSGGIVWSIIFMLSVAPGAISNVFLERFLKKQIMERKETRSHIFDVLILNFWASFIQVIVITSCFWLDIIPIIGESQSLEIFARNFRDTSECLFYSDRCPNSWYED